jgi:hypothetical protein
MINRRNLKFLVTAITATAFQFADRAYATPINIPLDQFTSLGTEYYYFLPGSNGTYTYIGLGLPGYASNVALSSQELSFEYIVGPQWSVSVTDSTTGKLQISYTVSNIPSGTSFGCNATSAAGDQVIPATGTISATFAPQQGIFIGCGASPTSNSYSNQPYLVTITSIIFDPNPSASPSPSPSPSLDLSTATPQISQSGVTVNPSDSLLQVTSGVPVQVSVPVSGSGYNSPETRSAIVMTFPLFLEPV